MRKIFFDIETTSAEGKNGRFDPSHLDLALVCIYDSETERYDSFVEHELPKLWPILERTDLLVGYNCDHFDIPLLNRYYPGDLTRIKSIDLLREIKNSIGKRLKLDSVAQATLGKKKSGSGLDAVRWWQEGDVEKVRSYCLDDVRLTKELYEYARMHGELRYNDYGDIRTIPLNTLEWEKEEEVQSMTHTLPF